MHEATIAQSILNIGTRKLQQNNFVSSVLEIQVALGEFRNVDIESLQFAFDNLKHFYKGLEGCQLQIEPISVQAICTGNSHIYKPEPTNYFSCPVCDSGIQRLISGEELDVIGVKLQAAISEETKDA